MLFEDATRPTRRNVRRRTAIITYAPGPASERDSTSRRRPGALAAAVAVAEGVEKAVGELA